VSADELSAFVSRAHDAGFPDHRDYLSAFVLGEVHFERSERHDMIRILGELGKHGSNLNQIAHAINAGRLESLSQKDRQMIQDARAAVDDVATKIKEALK